MVAGESVRGSVRATLRASLPTNLRTTLRQADRRLPQRLRRTARVVAGRAAFVRSSPLVSVVVAGRAGQSTALSACLDSLRAQDHRNLEVLVVLDDLDGRAATVVGRHAAEDWRITLVRATADGSAAGRNLGAARARGTYVAFARPEDTVPPSGLRRLVASLEESGSDFAFGRLAEVGTLHRNVSTVAHPAHETTRRGVSLQRFPLALTDLFDDNRVYRTTFFRQAALSFPDGPGATPALQAFARSSCFDALADTTYHRSSRGAGRPIGALVSAMADLDEWLVAQRVVQDFLVDAGGDGLQAWCLAVLDVEAVPLLDDAERATPEQWEALRAFLTAVRAQTTPPTWAMVRAESRTKVWLTVEGHREVLEHFTVQRLFEFGNRRTDVVDGRVLARFDGLDGLAAAGATVPEDCLEMGERETPLRVHLHHARWVDGGSLELELLAGVSFVSYRTDREAEPVPPQVRVRLVRRDVSTEGEPAEEGPAEAGSGADEPGPVAAAGTGSGELAEGLDEDAGAAGPDARGIDLTVRQVEQLEANLVMGHRHQDYAAGGLVVVLDAERLPAVQDRETWALEVEVTVRGLTRTSTVTSRDDRTTAGLLGQALHGPRLVGEGPERRLVALRAAARGAVAVIVTPSWPLHARDLATRGRVVTGRLEGAALVPGGATSTVVARGPHGEEATAAVVVTAPGEGTFELTLPRLHGAPERPAPRRWATSVVLGGSGAGQPVEVPLGFPAGVGRRQPVGADDGEVVASRGARGGTELW